MARATDNVEAELVDGTISSFRIRHISVPDPSLSSPRQSEVTKHTGDTEETEERRTVVRLDPIGEPVLVVTHERFSAPSP